jgi:hypothetical protein
MIRFAVRLPVLIVSVELTGEPARVTDAGVNVQVALDGRVPHERDTRPL